MICAPRLASALAVFISAAVVILAGSAPCVAGEFVAFDHQRQTIYHSPQTSRFTCWVGVWSMPDGDLMVSFTQATGPVEGRPRALADVQHQLT